MGLGLLCCWRGVRQRGCERALVVVVLVVVLVLVVDLMADVVGYGELVVVVFVVVL